MYSRLFLALPIYRTLPSIMLPLRVLKTNFHIDVFLRLSQQSYCLATLGWYNIPYCTYLHFLFSYCKCPSLVYHPKWERQRDGRENILTFKNRVGPFAIFFQSAKPKCESFPNQTSLFWNVFRLIHQETSFVLRTERGFVKHKFTIIPTSLCCSLRLPKDTHRHGRVLNFKLGLF